MSGKRVAVIGGGITGLTIARILRGRHDVCVFEREPEAGGLIRCARLDSGLFHLCGGHVFNTKNKTVMDWFRTVFDLERDFVKATRNAVVCMDDGKFVPYPIENNVYRLGEEIFGRFKSDMAELQKSGQTTCENFDEFLRTRFGNTLYQLYFRPYNQKIWQRKLTDVPLEWFDGKLPMPSAREMLAANENKTEEREMVHSSFWYPREGGSQFLVDVLAKGSRIRTGEAVENMEILADGGIRIRGDRFDAAFYCGDVRKLPSVMGGEAGSFDELETLECHGTTSVFCQVDDNPFSWVYQPSVRHSSHRIICTGNFSPNNNAPGMSTATVEFSGMIDKPQIEEQLKQMPFRPKYIVHHYTPCSYPVQGMNTRGLIRTVKDRLRKHNVFLAGRFAEWEYYNMDAAIASAMRAVDEWSKREGV